MGISLKKEHLKRYRDIAWLLIKYGNSDLLKNAGLEEILTKEEQPTDNHGHRNGNGNGNSNGHAAKPDELARILKN